MCFDAAVLFFENFSLLFKLVLATLAIYFLFIFFIFSFSRYFFGHYFETVHFQLLSGIKFSDRQGVYGPIYLSIILLTSVIAFFSTNIKKIKERYKEWIFHQNINNNLNNQQPENGDVSEASEPLEVPCHYVQLPFNIVKNNIQLINGVEMAVIVGFVIAICITLLFLKWTTYAHCSKPKSYF